MFVLRRARRDCAHRDALARGSGYGNRVTRRYAAMPGPHAPNAQSLWQSFTDATGLLGRHIHLHMRSRGVGCAVVARERPPCACAARRNPTSGVRGRERHTHVRGDGKRLATAASRSRGAWRPWAWAVTNVSRIPVDICSVAVGRWALPQRAVTPIPGLFRHARSPTAATVHTST